MPDSPAGRCAAAYFQTFASGDDGQMEAFIKKYRPKSYIDSNPIEKQIRFYRMVYSSTGPLIPTACQQVSENEIVVVVCSRKDSSMLYTVSFDVDAGEPHYLTAFSISRGASEGDLEIDPALVDKTIDQLAQILNQKYVIPELGEKMAVALLGNKTAGHYRKYTNGVQLANKLTADLVSLSQDKHIHIGFGPLPREEAAPVDSPEIDSSWGFTEVKIIYSNIGYIRLDKFCDPERAKGAAAKAMSIVAGCDVLIFDLRDNPGGAPGVDLLLASYLFEKPMLFGSRYSRLDNSTQDFYTFKDISGKPFGPKKPVYVLTSSMTYSAAEAFTYCLQDLKRATVVGEKTRGGAHPVIAIAVNEKFWMGLPYARAIGPVGKRDWEGVGVIPDISVPADEALAAALKDAAGRKKPSPVLAGPYLGQKPPGMTPEVFAPGIVSTKEFIDFKGAFSPDGREYYFYRHALPEILPVLFFTKIENGTWTKPVPLPVAQGARTYHPCVSPDNQWLFFFWQFQPEQNRPSGFYASARTPTGWSDPRYAGPGMYLTCDDSGRYYTTESVWGDQPKHYLASMTFSQGRFSRPERLTIQPHYENQTHPCIAPDGSYIIFDINVENGSLFVSFKDENGQWGEGIDLTKHGFKPDTRGAYISPDGKFLFFSVDGDIWWVDIRVIEKLRPEEESRGYHETNIEASRSQYLISAAEIIEEILTAKGVEGIELARSKLRELKKQPEKYLISETQFNSLGYRFLRQNRLPQAMTVFRMNAETFPRSANVYDSLAEAYLYWGDKYSTIRNYRKSLELDPQNENARSRLERMADLFEERHPTTPEDALFAAGKQTGLKGPYLGQRPPGLKKEVFAPGIVSTKGGHEFSCTFSPDGKEFYFNRGMTIMVCRWEEEGWTAPKPASFNGDFRNHEPHITADNRSLYFGSMRPNPDRPEMEDPYGLWRVERTENGWGEPRYAGYGMYVTTTTDGTIYLTDQDDEDFSKHGIARTKLVNGRFGPLERQKGGVLSPAPNRMSGRHPCIAPDESFLIFDSYTIDPPGGAAQLFISFRENDGSWGKATNLSQILESERNIAASLSHDGQYLFFRAESDIYWVSTKIFDHLKKKGKTS